ncbi:MAG TPA: serine hydrolase domain-containing protein [Xanthomonadales bacterium]|nr:serine hydrolase domain-containing protein [Xanthomonadales bacterium]
MSFCRSRLLAGLVFLLALPVSAGAATANSAAIAARPGTPPRVPGDDPRQLARIVAEFEQLQDGVMRTGLVTGLAAVVVKDGKVVSRRGLGVADVATRKPVTTRTVFRLASLSKAFAATLTALLVDRGYVRWDDRVQDLVPAFELSNKREASKLTVDALLSHRVGISHNAHDLLLERDQPYPMLAYKLREVPMICSVGDCYAYQNVAYSLIGDITFAVTGDFFYHQVERLLFHPLGMTTATYGRDALEASAEYARPHVRRGKSWVSVRPKESYYRLPPAAGVNASVEDLTQWLLAQLGHRPDVLPRALLDTLHTPVVETPGERLGSSWRRERVTAASYAKGWRVYDYAGERMVFHAGAVQGYRAMLGFFPQRDFGFALVWNCDSSVPAGLLPSLVDRYLGLPARNWLQLEKLPKNARIAAAGGR